MASAFKQAEITRGPFDPGGQPDTRLGQPLELGFFAWNIKGGMTASKAVLEDPQRYQNFWEWPNSARLIQLAEEVGFDYQVPFGRWIGQGGETDYNGAALDFLASAAATAPITKTLGLFSTAHITYRFHPLHVAKFGATVDHISNGRWGLNIVSGYSAREMAAFGFDEPISHDEAYAMADEFTCLMKYLWSEEDRFDFRGDYYYQAYGAYVAPKPVRKPRPVLMNAGGSEVGTDFATRHADWVFTTQPRFEDYGPRVNKIHEMAARHGRDVRVTTMVWVVAEATDELADRTYAWIESEIDREAVLTFIDSMQRTSTRELWNIDVASDDLWGGVGRETFVSVALGIKARRIVGGYDTVAEELRALQGAGLESILICFFDPQKGLHQMQDEIMPRLRKMGLRR